ncbi:MAG: hypothetical protein UW30_C0001G0057 [Candidatus Giovannonibacteria bacterium GW2011_GWA2_44_13b]|uniref:Uncharacterized protein n=2 Tax=Candidatus Giovannoniibacteriota TaxID=1752738 RepID=A0A0G1JE83_9BACT|nr:MAG: hypothetical protein UW30_C0001G0057 [Candidatus Giovannonibacteria bacterium GW2011_GWA2_44_13b]OGF83240.1 MAG: hypothetical protein A2924_02905 [Candidatus Giovannonibacteria bacterium RIFCSPLOWO2_01_FULL_44_16]
MDSITKKDLEAVLDNKLGQYQKTIVDAVDFKFATLETHIDRRFDEMGFRVSKLEENVNRLTVSLDVFLKKMAGYKEEFTILKAEVDKIKLVIKQKLGIEIAAQG